MIGVAPFAGAWIEIEEEEKEQKNKKSLPSRERGLKCLCSRCPYVPLSSLPSRERGLKFYRKQQIYLSVLVAPFAGAWIEIHV